MEIVRIATDLLYYSEELAGHGFVIVAHDMVERRHSTIRCNVVVKRIKDGTFWGGSCDMPATEHQDWDGDQEVLLFQVYPHQRTITEYTTQPPAWGTTAA